MSFVTIPMPIKHAKLIQPSKLIKSGHAIGLGPKIGMLYWIGSWHDFRWYLTQATEASKLLTLDSYFTYGTVVWLKRISRLNYAVFEFNWLFIRMLVKYIQRINRNMVIKQGLLARVFNVHRKTNSYLSSRISWTKISLSMKGILDLMTYCQCHNK